MHQIEEIVQTLNDIDVHEPSNYTVVLLNDNQTPMEFVIDILESIFHHDHDRAMNTMLHVHDKGEGAAGTYTFEIAEQKGLETTVAARSEGYPLRVRLDPA